MTGATPADWDPQGGAFGPQLAKLKNQYVGMTLGANPLLSMFTKINIPFGSVEGDCVKTTSRVERSYLLFAGTYSGPLSNPIDCLRREWNRIDQTQHLVHIYMTLLEQNDRVTVMGYYRDCSWSFGDWQPNANWSGGPAVGKDCKDQKREISKNDSKEISQWDQAIAVGSELNNLIHGAVDKAKEEATQRWGAKVADDLVYTQPNETRVGKAPAHLERFVDLQERHLDPPEQGRRLQPRRHDGQVDVRALRPLV